MSIARHHAEWLSLVPVSGPFLSLPVLMEAFSAGLEPHDPDQSRLLRQEYGNWQDSYEKRKADPAPLYHWIKFVLNKTLELDDRVLAEGQAIPQALQSEVPEHHELLRPSIVVMDPGSNKPRLLVQTYPRTQELTSYVANSRWKASPDTRMTELLHATDVRLGLITNGEQWMLVDAPKGETTGYASWYSALWLEEPITLRAFRGLLSASRFFNVPEDQTLESLLKTSASNHQEVTDQLGYQVRRAVEVLIHSLDRADQDFGRELLAGVRDEVLYESALTVMMRLVFLFCAEERELIPSKPFPVYEENYSVSTISKQLRELADQHGEELLERRYDAWPRLLAAFRALYGGLRHDDVHIPAYGGNLFNPDRFPFLEGRKQGTSWCDTQATPLPINNRTVLHLLEALQMLQIKVPGGGPAEARRLSFRALDIEQIGHVYEGLLDHTAKRATEPFLGLIGTRESEPEIPLAELEKLLAKSEADLLKFLKDETGKQEKALSKLLKTELDTQDVARFRTACQSDDALWHRVKPLAGLVRQDNFSYPVVIPKGSVFVTSGTDRRSSGTHYTPRSLTEPIVQYTLEPLVYVGPAEGNPKSEWKLKSASELLALKICDMACGSGAFLVQSARYMAERLLEAWDEAKKANPQTPGITPEGMPSTGQANEAIIPDDPAERKTYAMRIIAQRCLYGVDINPLAVEMAKLSLWLLTLAKDKPFEFLDHSIRCGDSLVGIHAISQLKNYSLKETSKTTFQWPADFEEPVESALNLRLMLESLPANTVDDVRRQENLLLEANDRMARLKCAADLLVAAEFWGENAKDKNESLNHAAIRTGHYMVQGSVEEFEQVAAKERRGQKMFHWPLEFPEVIVKRGGFDAFVGNPPFMGGSKITGIYGHEYRSHLVDAVALGRKGNGDLCAYFVLQAVRLLKHDGSCGLITTNTISQGDNREVALDWIVSLGILIPRAISSHKWPGTASLHVANVWLYKGKWSGSVILDNLPVSSIGPFLTPHDDTLGKPFRLASNRGKAFTGNKVYGEGFILASDEADKLLEANPLNRDVLFPFIIGGDLKSKDQKPSRWVINFADRSLEESQHYTECFQIVKDRVKPYRDTVKREHTRNNWWLHEHSRLELYEAILGHEQVLFHGYVNKYICFGFVSTASVFGAPHIVLALFVHEHFAVLQSCVHEAWCRRYSSTLGETLQYTSSDIFETFPFPEAMRSLDGSGVGCQMLRELGVEYEECRRQASVALEQGLTDVLNCVHTSTYSSSEIENLRLLQVEMDQAVAAAYGWTDLELGHDFHETKQGVRFTISEAARREVLQRLLKLNHERYAEEEKQGLHGKKGAAKKAASKKESASKPAKEESTLFDMEDDE